MDCKKDIFYRFMNNPGIDWRKLLYYLNLQLWSKIKVRSEHKSENACLIVDDTDYPKTGGVPKTSEEYTPMYRTVASLGSRLCFLLSQTVSPNRFLTLSFLGRKTKTETLVCPSRNSKNASQKT